MATFDTPEPISVDVDLGLGNLRIEASDRTDTVVEVRPSDPAKKADIAAAERTRVEYDGGRLLIKASPAWKRYSFWGGDESIDVHIELPDGSNVRGQAEIAALHSTGRLGECSYRTRLGEIHVGQAGPLQLNTGGGDITVAGATGRAETTTGFGAVRITCIDGAAVIKNGNGDTWIGRVTGDLRVSAANGDIDVDHATASVTAKTANGDVRLGSVVRGAILIGTGYGQIEVGVRDGVPAWLDLDTQFGAVRSDLDAVRGPEPGEDTVEVRARTSYGDIIISRIPAWGAGEEDL
jgi:hypothetical protein